MGDLQERGARLKQVLDGLGCTPAECAALAILAAGSLAGLGLLWFLAAADRPADADLHGHAPGAAATLPPVEVHAAEVVVHVGGAVERPGLVRLPGGSRVADALEDAGGPAPGAVLDTLNLARVLTDGEQLLVPDAEELEATADAPGGGSGGRAPGGSAWRPDGTLDVNRATAADLEQLPGVGPVTAERIVTHRESIGSFTELGQLRDVAGIGEKRFQAITELVGL